nr:hypothetical protein GCM10020241_37830 [Streptoalloteichus tenebrarius]
MLDADRLRLGLFSAATRDQWGQTTRAPWVLNVLDTRQGRYAYFQRDGYLTVLPADNRRITGLLQELLQAMERR